MGSTLQSRESQPSGMPGGGFTLPCFSGSAARRARPRRPRAARSRARVRPTPRRRRARPSAGRPPVRGGRRAGVVSASHAAQRRARAGGARRAAASGRARDRRAHAAVPHDAQARRRRARERADGGGARPPRARRRAARRATGRFDSCTPLSELSLGTTCAHTRARSSRAVATVRFAARVGGELRLQRARARGRVVADGHVVLRGASESGEREEGDARKRPGAVRSLEQHRRGLGASNTTPRRPTCIAATVLARRFLSIAVDGTLVFATTSGLVGRVISSSISTALLARRGWHASLKPPWAMFLPLLELWTWRTHARGVRPSKRRCGASPRARPRRRRRRAR